jgi:hypothetical protein
MKLYKLHRNRYPGLRGLLTRLLFMKSYFYERVSKVSSIYGAGANPSQLVIETSP